MQIVVDQDQLKPETLLALIEDFVTRDGAVQGHADVSLADKVQAVLRRVQAGVALIVFDEVEESFTIVTADEWRKSAARVQAERQIVEDEFS